MQKEVKSVNLETAISVLCRIVSFGEMMEFIEIHYKDSAKVIKEVVERIQVSSVAKPELCELAKNYECWLAVCLAERESGFLLDEFESKVGRHKAKITIDALIENNIIKSEKDSFVLVKKDFTFTNSVETVLAELRHFTQAFDTTQTQQLGHCMASFVHGFNDDGLKQVREIMREAALKVADLIKDKKFAGDKLAFSGVISGVIPE
jgi:uncharacterized membrane-anchored protein YjiN (DUF445 family)